MAAKKVEKKSHRVKVGWYVIAIAIVLLAVIAATPTDLMVQAVFSVSVLSVLLLLRSSEPLLQRFRLLFLYLALFLILRYLTWRLLFTLEYVHFADFFAALTLYLAELFSISLAVLSLLVNIRPLHRDLVEISLDNPQLPSVDVFVPTYNEPVDLVRTTLIAATQLRYPAAKLRVYLLDDGGTEQKCAQADKAAAAESCARRKQLESACTELGAHYLTRARNEQAKAGNINSALASTGGELILFLDADHVPTEDFLVKTVAPFLDDENLFLVQTPHFFINPDPVERNLERVHDMPAESEMFYRVIHHGLDRWNASFFCGSAAVMRRTHLDSIGGICTETVTEDAETALTLHAKGFNSLYIGHPMISGLQPETFTSFVRQRLRWAQGMVQIFLKKNPLIYPGLTLPQRISYLSSTLFWFFPYARMVFILAPSAYLLFGLHIYKASIPEVIAYALPHLIALVLINDILFGRHRWTFVSELYEIMQSLFGVRAITSVLLRPDSPKFTVTPKGEQLDHNFISTLARPFYFLLALVLISLLMGLWRYFAYPGQWQVTTVTMVWAVFNLFLLVAAFGVLLEQRQRRANPRMPANIAVEFSSPELCISGVLKDLSATGGSLRIRSIPEELKLNHLFMLNAVSDAEVFELPVRAVNLNQENSGTWTLGIEFVPRHLADERAIVRLAFGDSKRWSQYLDNRANGTHGVWAGIKFISRAGSLHGRDHALFLFRRAGARRSAQKLNQSIDK